MIYRYYKDLSDQLVPGLMKLGENTGAVTGRAVIPPEDNTEYVMYEVRTGTGNGDVIRLASPRPSGGDGGQTNHLYYVISGEGRFEVEDDPAGKEWGYGQDGVLALPPGGTALMRPTQETRVLVIHIVSDPALPEPQPLFTSLQGILGSDRDVDWSGGRGDGRSRRFVNRGDGFNCSVTLTSAVPGVRQGMQYVRHREGGYVMSGEITYSWEDGKKQATFKQDGRCPGNAMAMNLDDHVEHVASIGEQEMFMVCVFYPPLEGKETHDKSGASSY